MTLDHYFNLADVFDYPDASYFEKVDNVLSSLQKNYPEAGVELEAFCQLFPHNNFEQMQELYTRSFDVQAITTLDIGYVLFGDDYKRGELLANLNREHKQVKNDCGNELADHLPNILRLMTKLTDHELIEELVGQILVPALDKMINEFDPQRLEKKKKMYQKHYKTVIESSKERATLYCRALKALDKVLREDFCIKDNIISVPASDFLRSVGNELAVEGCS